MFPLRFYPLSYLTKVKHIQLIYIFLFVSNSYLNPREVVCVCYVALNLTGKYAIITKHAYLFIYTLFSVWFIVIDSVFFCCAFLRFLVAASNKFTCIMPLIPLHSFAVNWDKRVEHELHRLINSTSCRWFFFLPIV
jgi:hypothetical protein